MINIDVIVSQVGLGDGADSFAAVVGLALCGGVWPDLAGSLKQRAAQILEQPQPDAQLAQSLPRQVREAVTYRRPVAQAPTV